MSAPREPRDPELHRLMRIVAQDALRRIKEFLDGGKSFGSSSLVPRFHDGDSTFLQVSRDGSDVSYWAAIGHEADVHRAPYMTYQELEGYEAYSTYASTLVELVQFLKFPTLIGKEESALRLPSVIMGQLPLSIVERHIKLAGWDFSTEKFTEIYCELEQWWFDRELPIDTLLPIIGVSFTSDLIQLDATHRIERMSEGMQLARWPAFYFDPALRPILPCATHAFVASGGTVLSESYLGQLTVQPGSDASADADRFFQALLISQVKPSGYAQILYRPTGWAMGYEGALPAVIHGPVVRRFTPRVRAGMAEPSVVLSTEGEEYLTTTFNRLVDPDKNVSIASTRLLGSTMREEPVDRILDLCIGIEALVSDNSPGDTTYKLAIRSTAVLAGRGFHRTPDLFAAMKGIYTYRSAVAHGAKDAEKKRLVKAFEQQFDASNLAEFFLRELLQAFLQKNLTPGEIDHEYILGALTMLAQQAGTHGHTGDESVDALGSRLG